MKKRVLLVFFSFLISFAYADKFELSGVYLGKNLYVMNNFADSGVGFCVYEITINGQTSSDEINSSAFEIDLGQFNFEFGDKITVILYYKNGCLPKIMNPEVIQPTSSFIVQKSNVDENGTLHWTTSNEIGSIPFIVQQFRWNKWITVGKIDGKGNRKSNEYEVNVRLHFGKNSFRLCQIDYSGIPRYSSPIIYQSKQKKVSYGPEKIKDVLLFSDSTLYEIYDSYGAIILKGYGAKINLKGHQSGLYYINYDNSMDSFKKR
ncbi:hypothetical protein ACT3CE_18150 [Marinifilum sp. RC60d5]|uniref:hypothetical protein n=1 Tax=Marinifilum sp. RC60d5 TaxID=3458414 RepID=UPI00403713D2